MVAGADQGKVLLFTEDRLGYYDGAGIRTNESTIKQQTKGKCMKYQKHTFWVIIDDTENTGKPFIADDGENTGDLSSAKLFTLKSKADRWMKSFSDWKKWAALMKVTFEKQ